MRLNRIVTLTLLFLIVAGNVTTAKDENAAKPNDTSPGSVGWMINYLKTRNLPALKEVEPWENKYGPGLMLVTEHYRIHTTLLDPLMLSQVPGYVESAYNSYQKQLPEPVETKFEMSVYLFATRQQWEDFTKVFAGRQAPIYLKIKAGAYYLKDTWVGYNIGRERTFGVLGHEGWHQFNKRHFKFRLPSWLDEGIAMSFEASRYEKGLFKFDPSMNLNRLGGLKITLMKGRMIPLRRLIAMNPGEAIAHDAAAGEAGSSDEVMAFYSQAYALVRFLKEEGYGKRLANYHQMLMGGLQGTWPIDETAKRIAANRNIPLTVAWNRVVGTKLFEYYIGSDIEQIEREYLTFCQKLVYRVHFKK